MGDDEFQTAYSLAEESQLAVPPCPILQGEWAKLPLRVRLWAKSHIQLCQPDNLFIMTGSLEEDKSLKKMLTEQGVIIPLPKYDNCFLARTDPLDVARVESKTFISTPEKIETIPDIPAEAKEQLGHWISPQDLKTMVKERFPGCMKGRTMYMIPFSMGPIGGPLSKNGIELTDSAYVAICMRIMTRVNSSVLDCIHKDHDVFIKCLHSVGQPLKPGEKSARWPCNPEKTIIAHRPHEGEIISFGSGYGGNSLLGKKCFSLRIGSALAHKQGWLAEHMLIMGVQIPGSSERQYLCAAFPSACGKTNLAMLNPTIPGYKVTCVGDDIAWLRFDRHGDLRAINPENGFFGVAPGTSDKSNPMAMKTIFKNTIFTNVALTDDGGVWWEDMTDDAPAHLIDWKGQDWAPGCGRPSSHPNSRFCAPAENCPILDPAWEDPEGVRIEAVFFGGRRPKGVPLVYESLTWQHGVFLGASVKSEATAAAEFKGKAVMHDPFSMRPFFGYNFGHYLDHWLSFGKDPSKRKPHVFMVNWFRKDDNDKFLWPGFGDNIRVLDWALRRCRGERNIAETTPIGIIPKKEAMHLEGLPKINWEELFSVPKDFWKDEIIELRKYFTEQVGKCLPDEIERQMVLMEERFENN